MRKLIVVLIVLLGSLINGCKLEEYGISVINKSTVPVEFEFTTGHRTDTYNLFPNEEWNHSLLKAHDHSMGEVLAPRTVNYEYSDDVYTFYDAYTVTFNINGGTGTPPPQKIAFLGDEIILPNGNDLSREWYQFDGWTGSNGVKYSAGDTHIIEADIMFSAVWAPGF